MTAPLQDNVILNQLNILISDGKESAETTDSLPNTAGNSVESGRFAGGMTTEKGPIFGDEGFRVAPRRHHAPPSFRRKHFNDLDTPVETTTALLETTTSQSTKTGIFYPYLLFEL